MNPKVSFIIAAYNEEKYIKECIDSCLNQSYSNIEICITDDGSQDKTWKILEELQSEKVKISRFEKNQGKVSAFNHSFSMATGDYFALIGADDVNLPERIEKQLNFINSKGIDLTWSPFEHIDGEGNPLTITQDITSKLITKSMILQDNFIPGGTMMFNKSVASKVFPIPTELKFEDWWISFHAVYHFKFEFCKGPAIKYRIHANNTLGDSKIPYHETKRRNLRRHLAYHELFQKELEGNQSDLKLNQQAQLFKQTCLSDSFVERFSYFTKSISLVQIKGLKLFFKFFLVTILGLPLAGKIFK